MGKISGLQFHLYRVGKAEFMGPFGYLQAKKKKVHQVLFLNTSTPSPCSLSDAVTYIFI